MIFPLAHGALGWYDELIYLGVAVIFIAMMIISWLQSRGAADDPDIQMQAADGAETDENRFQLD